MKLNKILILILSLTLFVTCFAQPKVIKFTSLDWQPYTGSDLPDQGASIVVAKAAFEAMGYKLVVEFYPWERAVAMASNNADYAGYFPEYYSKEGEKDFIFSDPIGTGPLGFVENKEKPVMWQTMSDLEKYKVGVVSGYVNTEEFDKNVANGKIKAIGSVDDVTNIKLVAGKRLDIAVIDENVMNYLLDTNPNLKSSKGKLQFNPKMLEDKKLYLCFRRRNNAEELVNIFNEGLKKIDVDKIMKDYFNKIMK